MSNPFTIFRRNRRVMLAALTILTMFGFIFLPIILEGMGLHGGGAQTVVTSTKFGKLTELDLQKLAQQRQAASKFLGMALGLTQGKGAAKPQAWQLARQIISAPLDEDALVNLWLCTRYAEQMGMVVNEKAIATFIKEATGDALTPVQYKEVLKQIGVDDDQRLIRALQTELLALYFRSSFEGAAFAATPAELFEHYSRMHKEATIEAVPVAVSRFAGDVADPGDTVLKTLFEQCRGRVATPDSPEPGFRAPHLVKFDYFKADAKAYAEKMVTEEECREAYEADSQGYEKRFEAERRSGRLEDIVKGIEEEARDKPSSETGKEDEEDKSDKKSGDEGKSPEKAGGDEKKPAESGTQPPAEGDEMPGDDAAKTGGGEQPKSRPRDGKAEEGDSSAFGPRTPVRFAAFADADKAGEDDSPKSDEPPKDKTPKGKDKAPAKDKKAKDKSPKGDKPTKDKEDAKPATKEDSPADAAKSDASETKPESDTAPTPALPVDKSKPKGEEPKGEGEKGESGDKEPSEGGPELVPAMPKKSYELASPALKAFVRRELGNKKLSEAFDEARKKIEALNSLSAERREKAFDPIEFADKHGLEFVRTGMIPIWEAEKLDIRRAHYWSFQGDRPASVSVLRYLYSSQSVIYRPQAAGFGTNTVYLAWKEAEEKTPERLPEFTDSGMRQEVLKAWQMIQARKLALDEAAALEKQARKAGQPLAQVFANRKGLKVLDVGPFSWMTRDETTRATSSVRLSQPEGLEMPGREFMEAVFKLQPGGFAVAMNQPKTVAYLVRVVETKPGEETLWGSFASQSVDDYARITIDEGAEVSQQWYRALRERAGVTWQRTKHERQSAEYD